MRASIFFATVLSLVGIIALRLPATGTEKQNVLFVIRKGGTAGLRSPSHETYKNA